MKKTSCVHKNYYFNYKITFMCNQNCSYCYEKKDNPDIWNNYYLPFRLIQKEIQLFKMIEFPCWIELLGGEPLTHRYFKEILTLMVIELTMHSISISTNATARNIEKMKIPQEILNKVFWMLSWHEGITNFNKFKENCEYLLKNNCQMQVNIMTKSPNKEFLTWIEKQDLTIKFLDIWDPFAPSEEIKKIMPTDAPKYGEPCKYLYNEIFIDRSMVTAAECVLPKTPIKFDKEFVKNLEPYKNKTCPILTGCNVPNADLCTPNENATII